MLYDESRETIEWLWEWWLYCYGGMGCSVGGIEFRNLLTVTEEKSTEGVGVLYERPGQQRRRR